MGIKMFLKHKKTSLWISSAAIVIVIAAGVLLMYSASGNSSDAWLDAITPVPVDFGHTLLVYIDENYSEGDTMALQERIEATHNVASATFVSRLQALHGFMSRDKNGLHYEEIDESWFRDRFIVDIGDIALKQQTISDLQRMPGVVIINADIVMYDVPRELDLTAEQRQSLYEQNMASFKRRIILKSDAVQQ